MLFTTEATPVQYNRMKMQIELKWFVVCVKFKKFGFDVTEKSQFNLMVISEGEAVVDCILLNKD